MRRLLTALVLFSSVTILAACGDDSITGGNESEMDLATSDPGVVLYSYTESAARFGDGPGAYEVTIENLTPDTGDGGSQVFSPPVLATHQGHSPMYRFGARASEALALIAEDGMNAEMVSMLEGSDHVSDIVQGDGAIAPGGTATYRVEAPARFGKLSMAFMLVNTNDGFGGVDSLPLRARGGRATYLLYAYDAGSEVNTELYTDIPGPCCTGPGSGMDSDEPIHLHRGITGIGDLDPAKWGWHGAVARLTVERVQ